MNTKIDRKVTTTYHSWAQTLLSLSITSLCLGEKDACMSVESESVGFIGCTKMEQLISKSSPYFYPLSLGFTALVLIFSVVFTYKKLQNNRHPEPRSERPAKTQQQQKMDCDSTNNEDNPGGKTHSLSLLSLRSLSLSPLHPSVVSLIDIIYMTF